MAFSLEDGTGVRDANALVDISFVDEYASDMGILSWLTDVSVPPLTPDELELKKQRAIVAGSRWLDAKYNWRGIPAFAWQNMQWPRRFGSSDVTTPEPDPTLLTPEVVVIPNAIKFAVSEAAIRAYNEVELSPDESRGGQITGEKVGPISVTYERWAPAGTIFTAIESYLRPYMFGSSTSLFIETERV